jgi:valyl-tRNA synthetase
MKLKPPFHGKSAISRWLFANSYLSLHTQKRDPAMSIAKTYNAAEREEKWYQYWETSGFFRSVPDEREPYTIVIPPPNVTGMLHMGHMLNNTIQDILIRRKRMEGYNACWVPGTDHASIATEAKVVRLLRDQGIKKSDLTRDEFLKHAFEWKDKYGGIILDQLRKLGASCDWERTRFTMDDDYYRAVIMVFCDLYEKGYIYRELRMVNWDPSGLTALSDEEVIHKEQQGKLYYVRYKVEGTSKEYVTIATTRPETILGDTAISVNPKDMRFMHLVGKKVIVPLINRAIPIIADDYVDMDFGTGCLKVTPAHDVNDYEIGKRHNLETIDVLNPNGTMSEAAQLYIGEDRFIVRKKISKDLEAAGHMVKIEEYKNTVGHSERTDAIIEPRLSLQWWVNMKEISKPALQAVMDDTVKLIPAKFKNTYRHWMENVKDWCISRQLWWGQQIPAFYLHSENELPEHQRQFFVGVTPEVALEKARAKTGLDLNLDDLRQDADVLDTWFSSWLWPFQVFKSLTEPGNAEAAYYYPTNDLVTGPDILFFWVARMIIAGYEYEGKEPFKNVYLTGLIRDALGRKMSKSLGNSPDPLELMALYGADGVRFGVLTSSPAGGDLTFDTPIDLTKKELESKLCEQGRNFRNKIWNASNLVQGWVPEAGKPLAPLESVAINWMKRRLSATAAELADHFEKFRISDALATIRRVIWDEFCGWFLEMMKPNRDEAIGEAAREQVVQLFESLLQLAHPFVPFITEEIWQSLRLRKEGESIMMTLIPEPIVVGDDFEALAAFALVQDTVTAVRAFKADKGIPGKDQIDLYVNTQSPETFKANLSVLDRFLGLRSMQFVEKAPAGTGSLRVLTTEFYIPLGDNIDIEAEKAKLLKDIAYNEGFLVSVEKKLGNEKFMANAAAAVVEAELKKKADSEATLRLLRETLAGLG